VVFAKDRRTAVPSTVNELSPTLKEIAIEVSGEDVARAVERAYAKLGREARVRGFRRGKAPRGVLRRMYGKALLNEVRGEIVSAAFVDALKEHDIDPVSEPEIDADELIEGQGYSFKFTIETTPRLEEVNLEGIEVERYKVEVASELVDVELKRLRDGMATTTDLEEPRPARAGDMVRINGKRWEEGEWTSARMPPEQELVLERGSLPDELFEALEGASVDEEKVVEIPHTGPEGKPGRLLIKLLGIKERQLPELDDELAKDVGDFETLADLEADVEQRLKEMLEKNENDRIKQSLFSELRDKNPLELPASLVERQTQAMKEQFRSMLAQAEKTEDADEEAARKKLEDGAGEAARNVIHQHLLMKEIARLWEVQVADDELDEELKTMAQQSGLPLPMLRAEYAKGGRLDELKSNIVERKVFDLALTKVKIVEVDRPTGDEEESATKATENEEPGE
jgi:trigger factor